MAPTEDEKKMIRGFYDTLYACYGDGKKVDDFYTENIDIYDDVLIAMDYPFKRVAMELEQIARDEGRDPSTMRVLDAGAGTGLLGVELNNKGFNDIDALDLNKVMLDVARTKSDIYKNFLEVGIYYPEETVGVEANTYDAVTSTGCFTNGHIEMEALFEIARMCRKGAIIMYTLNPGFKDDYMGIHGKAMKEGVLELLYMKQNPYKYDCYKDFKKVWCYLCAFKVL